MLIKALVFSFSIFHSFWEPNRANPCEATREGGNKQTKPYKE